MGSFSVHRDFISDAASESIKSGADRFATPELDLQPYLGTNFKAPRMLNNTERMSKEFAVPLSNSVRYGNESDVLRRSRASSPQYSPRRPTQRRLSE